MNNYNNNQVLYCKYCNKECKNINSLKQHECRCKENPNRLDYKPHLGCKGSNQFIKAKENNLVYIVSEETRKKISQITKGRKHSEKTKKLLSDQKKKYLNENPDKIPFLLNHSSKESYPEKYFKELFKNENILLKYHLRIGRYELDFYNEDLKKYIEIDGEQHYLPKMILHDNERTKYLENLGWKGLRIRWSEFYNLNIENKKLKIEEIKQFLSL